MVIQLRFNNPILTNLEHTFLSQNINTTTTSLNVISSQFFASSNELILVGNDKYDNSEVKRIASISGNVISTTTQTQNTHITGERVRKLIYDKIAVYKKSVGDTTFSLLTTIDITYNNPQGETLYVYAAGLSTDTFKAKYTNSITLMESDFSAEFIGSTVPSGSSYLSLSEFRDMTGVSDSEIPDGVLSEFLTRATYDSKKKCFAFSREVLINPDTINNIKRYYFSFSPTKTQNRFGYLTDWNLDGLINTSDIVVYEKDSTGAVRNVITNQVDSLNTELGYFTLNSGYPSSNQYKVYASFGWMNMPLYDEYVKYDFKRLIMHLSMMYIIEWYRNQIRRGITKQTLGGLTIERSREAWNELEDYHYKKSCEFINRFKPLLWSTASDQSTWSGVGSYYGYGSYYNTGNYSPYYSKY